MEGDRGTGDWEKRGTGGVREAGEDGAGSEILKVAGSRRKREKLGKIAKYFGMEKCKEVGANKYMVGTGLKGLESGRFKPPCPLNFKVLLPLDGMGKRGEGYTQRTSSRVCCPEFQTITRLNQITIFDLLVSLEA